MSYGRERQGCPLRREPGIRVPRARLGRCRCFLHINDIDIDEGLPGPAKVSFDVEDTDRGSKATNVAVTEPAADDGAGAAPIVARIGTVVVIAAMTATTIADTTGAMTADTTGDRDVVVSGPVRSTPPPSPRRSPNCSLIRPTT